MRHDHEPTHEEYATEISPHHHKDMQKEAPSLTFPFVIVGAVFIVVVALSLFSYFFI